MVWRRRGVINHEYNAVVIEYTVYALDDARMVPPLYFPVESVNGAKGILGFEHQWNLERCLSRESI